MKSTYDDIKVQLDMPLFPEELKIFSGFLLGHPKIGVNKIPFFTEYPHCDVWAKDMMVVGLPKAGIYCEIVRTGEKEHAIHEVCHPRDIPAGSGHFRKYPIEHLHEAKEFSLAIIFSFILRNAMYYSDSKNIFSILKARFQQIVELYPCKISTTDEIAKVTLDILIKR